MRRSIHWWPCGCAWISLKAALGGQVSVKASLSHSFVLSTWNTRFWLKLGSLSNGRLLRRHIARWRHTCSWTPLENFIRIISTSVLGAALSGRPFGNAMRRRWFGTLLLLADFGTVEADTGHAGVIRFGPFVTVFVLFPLCATFGCGR